MSNAELKFPDWQAPLQEVILEFDDEKLPGKMHEVENLLSERLQQLGKGFDGHTEREAINDAWAILRIIRHDRLGNSSLPSAVASALL
jgi:hypothetical protein